MSNEYEDSIPGQLHAIRARLDHGERRMAAIENSLTENTAITRKTADLTQSINDAVTAGRVMTKVIKFAGMLAAACSAVWIAWYQWTHQGKMP